MLLCNGRMWKDKVIFNVTLQTEVAQWYGVSLESGGLEDQTLLSYAQITTC